MIWLKIDGFTYVRTSIFENHKIAHSFLSKSPINNLRRIIFLGNFYYKFKNKTSTKIIKIRRGREQMGNLNKFKVFEERKRRKTKKSVIY
jgi:hypothetical protein